MDDDARPQDLHPGARTLTLTLTPTLTLTIAPMHHCSIAPLLHSCGFGSVAARRQVLGPIKDILERETQRREKEIGAPTWHSNPRAPV
eukprot:4461602-Prymnesium_polylepis.1